MTAAVALAMICAAIGCEQSKASQPVAPAATVPAPTAAPKPRATATHDLSADERMGGHTLARHVGKTDDELRERLSRERDISAASTYTDRETAEAVVGAALSSAPRSLAAWRNRSGSRPNFVLHFAAHRVIGRSISRNRTEAASCQDALVIIRWDARQQSFFVLTSYPEERR